jgi:hypothetical protein
MKGFRFSLCQHPIGQGGFHSGAITGCQKSSLDPFFGGQHAFRWVYDCGSDQLDSLNEEIKSVKGTQIDVLFLSHLHEDHINGVDSLLLNDNATVKEVVLPYLDDDDWVLHLAARSSEGTLSGTFIDLVDDPENWFESRGIERLTYVLTDSDDDEENDGPASIDLPKEAVERNERDEHYEISWTRGRSKPNASQTHSGNLNVSLVEKGEIGSISASGQTIDWVLSPYAYRPSYTKKMQFQEALEKEFACRLSRKEYAKSALTSSGRKALRKCYDTIWNDHNLHSMVLYTGPSRMSKYRIHTTSRYGNFVRRITPLGWVLTGDFKASGQRRREKMLKYYSRYAENVGHINLPHHGSDDSFDIKLLTHFPNLVAAIAATGPNSYGHPGLIVQREIAKMSRVNFVRVDQNPSSVYKVEGCICV